MTATTKLKPDWAGQDLLSRLVNVLIKTKPLYAVMKQQARKVLIKTAEKNGVAWRENVTTLKSPETQAKLESIVAQLTDPDLAYPDYYNVPFHAYNDGNLCWLAAYEAEPATYAMAMRVWLNEAMTWETAQDRLRSSFHHILDQHGPQQVQDILDIGCSVGISTRSLHQFYQVRNPQLKTTGLDLSPYMLSVASLRDAQNAITWQHGKAESTGFADQSWDIVTLQFVVHELPQAATRAILAEIHRILRPGGCLAIVDNNPQSPVIQNLPPVLFTLMKSTEPWSDEYYTFDLEAALTEAGFSAVMTEPSDPRHRTIIAQRE
ncbi:class I SAM-dependent methyltransferase [filamentous cyanobacterium LEGE 11480]|uniref:Class I SAM-dependent methyltransferase n=1 Tax=Romeriopsis navalis LEGE 11480 TaxID=2777977 RepID=A0A928VR89_9CYAN|nr:class I SAM-dependent methyltransferase [Romeriopsis navalis]MBE9032277.1 class I SAM-dependent methyltransferase [Romeriopsis navalis LEGE 11480]